ncbi:SDR family oxidoreductase [Thermodesulfobacteriota bacterium]
MGKPKAIVFGALGLVGQYMAACLEDSYHVVRSDRRGREGEDVLELDITDHESVSSLIDEIGPDLVVNAVNLAGGVDFCETDKVKAKVYHFDVVVNLARGCRRNDATLVFMSTDYIFDGTAGPYSEEAEPNPLNTYGLLKLMSEEYIRRCLESHLIVRTTNIYGYDPESPTPNFVTSLLRRLSKGEGVSVPVDQYGNPTLVNNLVEAICDLLDQGKTGVYNIVGPDWVNRLEWAKAIADIFGFDGDLASGVETKDLTQAAFRPLRSGFVLDKVMADLRVELVGLKAGLEAVKSHQGT